MKTIYTSLIVIFFITCMSSCTGKNTYVKKKYSESDITVQTIQYAEVDFSNILSIWVEEFDLDASFASFGGTVITKVKKWGLADMDTDLKMKVYSPPKSKWGKRPVILLFHGGAYVTGDFDNPSMKVLCNEFAQRGYVAISVQYRKMNLLTPSLAKAGYIATQDARAAIRYVANHSKELDVNPDKMFLGGVSAGACTVLHAAFLDQGEDIEQRTSKLDRMYGHLDCIGEKKNKKFNIRGILNISGAIRSLDWIDNNDIPVIHFYGEDDTIIPKTCGVPFPKQGHKYDKIVKRLRSLFRKYDKVVKELCEAELFEVCSSKEIHLRLKKNRINSQCHEFKGADHSFMVSSNGNLTSNGQEVIEMTAQFFKDQL